MLQTQAQEAFALVPGPSTARRRRPLWSGLGGVLALILVVLNIILPAGSADEKRIAIYTADAHYSLPLADRNGREYVGLLEVLGPLGTVSSRTDGLHWKLRFNNAEAEFTANQNRAKVQGRDFDLTGNFLLESGRGLVPTNSLGTLLPRILGGPVTLNEPSRRIFIGNVATHFTAQLSHTTPPRLVMNFSAPVNPTIATEPGKLRMSFTREPVVAPGSPTLTFGDKTIPSATYSESNGSAEITVNGGVALMASFSNDGRTITVAPAPQQPVALQQPAQVPSAAPASVAVPPGSSPPAPVLSSSTRRFYAVLDASHGGDDRGVALSNQLAEKDVTLALARRLRQELEARGISTLVLRDSDATLTQDQRATFANTVHPVVYISVHAASDGKGVRLYTALLPAAEENNGPFVDWNTAQAQYLAVSRAAAQGVATQLQKQQIQVRMLAAPLRPLNNITAAAIAVEVAPPGSDVMDLNLVAYQQNVASAVANGIAAVRAQLGEPR
jgi:N-acetylmuramoyl-L-alanine amidase